MSQACHELSKSFKKSPSVHIKASNVLNWDIEDGFLHCLYLIVEVATDLGELAVPLDDVLDAGALHEEGVLAVGLLDPGQALRVAGHHDAIAVVWKKRDKGDN